MRNINNFQGAEDGLLKQLKETQELQEKLMIHQNDLINKLEGEHEPHAAGEQQKPDDKKGVVNAKGKSHNFLSK